MTTTACPVVGCASGEPAHPAFVIARVGPNDRVPVALCLPCRHRTGESREPVHVEYRPPIGRWRALVRVTVGEPGGSGSGRWINALSDRHPER